MRFSLGSKMDFNWLYANVMKNKKYSNVVLNGLEIYENILMQEKGK